MVRSVSIVICTVNRADALERCLASVARLQLPPTATLELIVVDNNSTDGTKAVIEAFKPDAAIAVRGMFEEKRGKSHALNLALSATTADVVFFTDDDCVLRHDLVVRLVEEFSAHPELDGIGGRVELLDPLDLPIAIQLRDSRAELTSITQVFGLIPGCNMAYRRRVIDRIGGFDTRLGPGTPRVAEDADFVYRSLKAGFRLGYVPDIVIYHGHGRRNPADIFKTKKGYLNGRGAFYAKHILSFDRDVLRSAYWEALTLLRLSAVEAGRLKLVGEGTWSLGMILRGAGSYLKVRLVA